MAAPAGLPDLNTLDVFQYDDVNQNRMVDIVSADNTHPRVISDYVLDPVEWQPANRGVDRGDGAGPPNGVNTVQGILGFRANNLRCFVCDDGRPASVCRGQPCIDIAKAEFEDMENSKLIIREAQWGYGVFAHANIQMGDKIGEYLGRLRPLDSVVHVNNRYIYTIDGHADCDAEQYGNITRYINHHCASNSEAEMSMYGRRVVMLFKTNRFIRAGEEITIDYGENYFDESFPCACDAFDYPHTSEPYRRRVYPDGSVSPTGVGTYGNLKGKRREQSPSGGSAGEAEAGGSGVDNARAGKTRAGKGRVEKAEVARIRMRVSETRLSSIKKASAPRSRRRRSWGSMAYKGGDPDRPLRRSARIAAIRK